MLLTAAYLFIPLVFVLNWGYERTSTVNLIIIFLGAIQVFTYKKLYLKRVLKSVKLMIEKDKANKTLEKKTITIRNEKLIFEESYGVTTFNLNGIKKIEFSEKCLFLFIDEISAVIIPKSVFHDNEKMQEFIKCIKTDSSITTPSY